MKRSSAVFSLLLLAFGKPQAQTQAALQCKLSDPIVLDDDGLVTMEQVANREEGTFTMRIKYTGGQSWIGIGINLEGSDKMTPAAAVIGRMLEDTGEASVLKYDLESDDKDASGVVPMAEDQQSLRDISFTQTESESVLEFTQNLNDYGSQVVSDDSVWIYAIGLPDNEWTGKHKIHGAFLMELQENCQEVPEPESTQAPTQGPPAAETENPPVGAENPSTETENPPVETGGSDGTSTTPIDTTSDSSSSLSSEDGDEDSQANSGNNQASTTRGITKLADATESTRPLWVAHGYLMAIAWGICAPIAIGAPMLRQVSFLATNGRWYSIHFYLNIMNVLLTSIGFFLAVAATQQEGKEHFTEDVHHKAGLSIFVIVLFQTAMGFVRPPAKAANETSSTKQDYAANNPIKRSVTYKNSDLSNGPLASEVEHGDTMMTSENSSGEVVEIEEDSVSHSSSAPNNKPRKTRLAWEISHRFIGMTLLGLSWYNCTSGIELQVDKYDENDDLTAAFWGVCGGISGLIFFLAYVVRVGK